MRRRLISLSGLVLPLLGACAAAPADAPPAPPPIEQAAIRLASKPDERHLAELALAAQRLQAHIDRQIAEYQTRPRKRFVGQNATEYRFAQYEEDWRQKVERIGRANYPEEIRGGPKLDMRLTVSIKSDGSVQSVTIDRSSGNEAVDRAALRIIELASPFAPFPPSIARDTDLLVITRTWFFGGPASQEAK